MLAPVYINSPKPVVAVMMPSRAAGLPAEFRLWQAAPTPAIGSWRGTYGDPPPLRRLLNQIEDNGVRTVIVGTQPASRETSLLRNSASLPWGDHLFKVVLRQIAGAFAQREKARLVSKLKGARDRKRVTGIGSVRAIYAETRLQVAALTEQLHRKRSKGGQRSLREVAHDPARGPESKGKTYPAAAIAR